MICGCHVQSYKASAPPYCAVLFYDHAPFWMITILKFETLSIVIT